ncbi:hypothetical protein HMPREF0620_0675 [Parascardovia denticolens DSM 10105 = JCM 12538]|uniref:Uncharacterized protein n=1 Tax=Parascardovia denticolens DSM 10105 = JCM 12538 TaxID=864564 RepID=E6K1I9_PARDN|nr:hypothetical protein HMPREF0620_0675 [Parascardovia denticolens DSM 10105 = JCM 12538]
MPWRLVRVARQGMKAGHEGGGLSEERRRVDRTTGRQEDNKRERQKGLGSNRVVRAMQWEPASKDEKLK